MNCAGTGSAPTDATVAAFSLAAIHATFPPVPPAFTYPIRFKPPFRAAPTQQCSVAAQKRSSRYQLRERCQILESAPECCGLIFASFEQRTARSEFNLGSVSPRDRRQGHRRAPWSAGASARVGPLRQRRLRRSDRPRAGYHRHRPELQGREIS